MIKRFLTLTFFLVAGLVVFSQSQPPKKVLMVVSSYGKNMGADRPGFEMDEFSQAYLIFKNNGLQIDVASPKGGKVEPDKFNTEKKYNQDLVSDETAMEKLEQTITTSQISSGDYDAIYVVGGKGAMFDLPFDPSLQDILLEMYQREGTVLSSVCHGPAAFVNVKDGDQHIIQDVDLTGFCNMEEQLFGKKWVPEFPFKLEDKLIERGAKFQQADFMLAKTVVSGKFVTGQNPFSTAGSAEAVVRELGIEPASRTLYDDEKSVYLIQDVLEGTKSKKEAAKELKKDTASYEVALIAIYGYYKIMAANDDPQQLQQSVDLIELSSPYFFNEQLQLVLAKTYAKLNNEKAARTVLEDLIAREKLVEDAQKVLAELGD